MGGYDLAQCPRANVWRSLRNWGRWRRLRLDHRTGVRRSAAEALGAALTTLSQTPRDVRGPDGTRDPRERENPRRSGLRSSTRDRPGPRFTDSNPVGARSRTALRRGFFVTNGLGVAFRCPRSQETRLPRPPQLGDYAAHVGSNNTVVDDSVTTRPTYPPRQRPPGLHQTGIAGPTSAREGARSRHRRAAASALWVIRSRIVLVVAASRHCLFAAAR
jgi:hypothetical protein